MTLRRHIFILVAFTVRNMKFNWLKDPITVNALVKLPQFALEGTSFEDCTMRNVYDQGRPLRLRSIKL